MSDTLGGLIDKLFTADMKMWVNQENFYVIRKMTFEEFAAKFIDTPEGQKMLYEYFKKACDLNVQRNAIIDEIDEKTIEIIKEAIKNPELLDNGKFIQRKHKTY